MSGMGFNRNSMSNLFAYLFGDGSDGDVTISANTDLVSTLNGDIVYKNYNNLTIDAGCTLSVSNMCKGLWIRVRGTLTLNGAISMSNKGCYIAGGGDDLYLCYNDILVPKVGAAGGAHPTGTNAANAGADGTDGRCGGGGSGGYRGGAGAYGGVSGGGAGGSGGWYITEGSVYGGDGEAGQAYGLRGGNGIHGVHGGTGRTIDSGGGAGGVTGGTSGGGAATAGQAGSGGILVIMANAVVGSGQLLSRGANGGVGTYWHNGDYTANAQGASGGGSGGGSITLFYYTMSGTPTFNAAGGAGGAANEVAGGAGGAGSCRDYSLAELLSHTRV